MPIQRRTPAPTVIGSRGWTHHIHTRHFIAGIRVVDRKVVDAEPQLHWMINQRYDKIVESCNTRGDEIIKIEKGTK